jgi:hypothetical protein
MRQILGVAAILITVWSMIFLGAWIISAFVVPLDLHIDEWWGRAATSAVKVILGSLLAILWLWIWKTIAQTYFWRTVGKD